MTQPTCAREGCNRWARGDEFCSTACFRMVNNTLDPGEHIETDRERRNRKDRVRRLRKKIGDSIAVPNPDAMSRRAPGSFESGKKSR